MGAGEGLARTVATLVTFVSFAPVEPSLKFSILFLNQITRRYLIVMICFYVDKIITIESEELI